MAYPSFYFHLALKNRPFRQAQQNIAVGDTKLETPVAAVGGLNPVAAVPIGLEKEDPNMGA